MNFIVKCIFIALAVFAGVTYAVERSGPGWMDNGDVMGGSMMQCGMMGEPMMIAWLLFVLLVIGVLVLAVFALIKYLRSEGQRTSPKNAGHETTRRAPNSETDNYP